MKVKYVKRGKFNHAGKQYRQGDVLEVENIKDLPENWFETVGETETKETKEKKPKKFVTEEKIKEVIDYGIDKNADEDLGS